MRIRGDMRIGDDIYPCTITRDRYGGVYSGGLWLAWPLYLEHVPKQATEDDITCAGFWGYYLQPVGKGETLDEAYADLLHQLS